MASAAIAIAGVDEVFILAPDDGIVCDSRGEWQEVMALDDFVRYPLAGLPTPLYRLEHLTAHLRGPDNWIKRDDCTELTGGGKKLESWNLVANLVADALKQGADMLVTVGGIQSNHTRQTAADRCCGRNALPLDGRGVPGV